MKISAVWGLVASALVARGVEAKVEIDVNNRESLIKFATESSHRILGYYKGNLTGGTPGVIPEIYWWEAGAMFGTLLDYWWYTDDASNNPAIQQALIHQADAENGWKYEPRNRTLELGNDDQGYWAIAVMAAAEKRFPEVDPDKGPGWLALAQRVFEAQHSRWDETSCGGGLHWQITVANNGYNYKNTVSNGLYFQLGARLGRYTGNETYLKLAEEAYEWMESERGYISDKGQVFDGAHLPFCTEVNPVEWSYNAGIVLAGAAYMWNVTQSETWKERVNRILDHTLQHYSRPDIADLTYEYACEQKPNCDQDQRWFKGHLHRFLGLVYQLCPFTQPKITPKFKVTASYAARSCVGGASGKECGMRWWYEGGDVWDGIGGVSVEASVLEAVQNTLLTTPKPAEQVKEKKWIYKASDGGVASRNSSELEKLEGTTRKLRVITDAQRAGAWIMTMIMVAMAIGLVWFVAPNPK